MAAELPSDDIVPDLMDSAQQPSFLSNPQFGRIEDIISQTLSRDKEKEVTLEYVREATFGSDPFDDLEGIFDDDYGDDVYNAFEHTYDHEEQPSGTQSSPIVVEDTPPSSPPDPPAVASPAPRQMNAKTNARDSDKKKTNPTNNSNKVRKSRKARAGSPRPRGRPKGSLGKKKLAERAKKAQQGGVVASNQTEASPRNNSSAPRGSGFQAREAWDSVPTEPGPSNHHHHRPGSAASDRSVQMLTETQAYGTAPGPASGGIAMLDAERAADNRDPGDRLVYQAPQTQPSRDDRYMMSDALPAPVSQVYNQYGSVSVNVQGNGAVQTGLGQVRDSQNSYQQAVPRNIQPRSEKNSRQSAQHDSLEADPIPGVDNGKRQRQKSHDSQHQHQPPRPGTPGTMHSHPTQHQAMPDIHQQHGQHDFRYQGSMHNGASLNGPGMPPQEHYNPYAPQAPRGPPMYPYPYPEAPYHPPPGPGLYFHERIGWFPFPPGTAPPPGRKLVLIQPAPQYNGGIPLMQSTPYGSNMPPMALRPTAVGFLNSALQYDGGIQQTQSAPTTPVPTPSSAAMSRTMSAPMPQNKVDAASLGGHPMERGNGLANENVGHFGVLVPAPSMAIQNGQPATTGLPATRPPTPHPSEMRNQVDNNELATNGVPVADPMSIDPEIFGNILAAVGAEVANACRAALQATAPIPVPNPIENAQAARLRELATRPRSLSPDPRPIGPRPQFANSLPAMPRQAVRSRQPHRLRTQLSVVYNQPAANMSVARTPALK